MRLRLTALSKADEMRDLLKECDSRLAALPLPDPFSISALVTSIEESMRRRIQLIALEDHQEGAGAAACGLRVREKTVDYVIYHPRPTPHQTEHRILHQLAHEWLDHGTEPAFGLAPYELSESLRQAIGPGPAARQVIPARPRYSYAEECEADLTAYLIKHRVRAPGAGTDLISRLEATLSHPLGPRRRRTLRAR
ncbi:hypothetical protein EDD93_4737 [Streptomyces sp. 840.1]|uniref:hypothetical protein n=1 Tax=Streptomyces sp. 840.1 TaxID=2485152 RepID=UPI000F46722E|nr:hypothetical protein [Streptomyces sp. 840.1]ROQ70226.1 hypothetical protein EDD93_4737 [Streptomyces sp. 840.1]